MTFAEFQASGVDCPNLGTVIQDEMLLGAAGRIYCDSLYIEDTTNWPTAAPGYGKGRWYTLIGRDDRQSDNLPEIEQYLYEFAVRNGYSVGGDDHYDVITVANLLTEYGFGAVNTAPENAWLRQIEASCHVGQAAMSAIAAGNRFAAELDPHPSVRAKIGAALVEHIRILYYG